MKLDIFPEDFRILDEQCVIDLLDATKTESGSSAETHSGQVVVKNIDGFYPSLVASEENSPLTYSQILNILARECGGVRLLARFTDAKGQECWQGRVQLETGKPYYGKQPGLPSPKGSRITLPTGLPEDGQPLLICEGEKAAAASISAGFHAACWYGGSGNAKFVNLDELKGIDLVLCPDQDNAGIKAMRTLGRRMDSSANTVRVMDIAGMLPGTDVADIPAHQIVKRVQNSIAFGAFQDKTGGRSVRQKRRKRGLPPDIESLAFKVNTSHDIEIPTVGLDAKSALTPASVAELVINLQKDKMLLVEDGENLKIFTSTSTGTWSEGKDALAALISDTGKHFLRIMMQFCDSPPFDDDNVFVPVVLLLRSIDKGKEFTSIKDAMMDLLKAMKEADSLPSSILTCQKSDINANPRYRGYINGVADMEESRILNRSAARSVLCTMENAEVFRPQSTH